METILIDTEYITLGQFLKYTAFISNGGEAKIAVLELKIAVNGVPESRRGRKIYPNDVVKVEKRTFKVIKNDEN